MSVVEAREFAGACELALAVKVADRLANVRACTCACNTELLAMYRSEQAAFRAAAFRTGLCDALWQELEQLLAQGTRS